MSNINAVFFELIRVALGIHDGLSLPPSELEWGELYRMAEKQSLIGLCFAGVERLPNDMAPDLDMLVDWLGQTEYIKSINELVNQQCVEVQKRLLDAGFDSCILKGQGVGVLYGALSPYRSPGDIDIWVVPKSGKIGDWRKALDYVNAVSPNKEFDGKHTHLHIFHDTSVEVHWWPSTTSNIVLNRKMKKFYREQAKCQLNHKVLLAGGQSIVAADPVFDSIHVLMHIFGHFLYEGVGLRQILDFYYVCIQDDVQHRKEEITVHYKDFGLYQFSRSVMWVLQEVFNMSDKYLLVAPDSKGGRELLVEIMAGGNLGQASAENQIKNESTVHRWIRRGKRKIRLFQYNPVGVICNPFYKIWLGLWKTRIIKMYKLQ